MYCGILLVGLELLKILYISIGFNLFSKTIFSCMVYMVLQTDI